MSFTMKLDTFSHDIHIKDGKFVRIKGSDEVRQRIKVALWHHFDEYFLNRPGGLPWYSKILGSKMNETTLQNLIRNKVQQVPGVIQVLSIAVTRKIRDYIVSIACIVRSGPGETQTSTINISGITIGGE